ncbi:MAG: 4Fe-4S dicluster domain-containing protein, partial [Chloroflexi bacterium]|nr:4Fe-4S dicluster domain-containing protein [Chloroflexota bacterium]
MATAPEKPRTDDGLNIFAGPDAPQESELYKCVHCGFCLQACPTYVETGLEAESPRGRIALMKAVNEGRIGITDSVMRHWDLCIQCRACEVACPSGVPYGNLIEATMQQVADRRSPGYVNGKIATLALNKLLPNQTLLSMVIGGMRMYQRFGVQKVMRKSGLLKLLPGNMGELEDSMPTLPTEVFKASGQVYRARGEVKAKVALLSGCVMPLIHGPEMNAVVRVLTRNGCEVVVTKEQGCCGAINSHVGDLDMTRELARRNVDAFLAEEVDYVV